MRAERRSRAFAVAVALTALIATALSFRRLPAPPRAARVAAVDPAPPAGAALVARRFLDIYVHAYAGRVSAADRAQLHRLATPQVSAPLLNDVPDERLAGGRVAGVRVRPVDRLHCEAVVHVLFQHLDMAASLSLAREPARGWRVERFEPSAT